MMELLTAGIGEPRHPATPGHFGCRATRLPRHQNRRSLALLSMEAKLGDRGFPSPWRCASSSPSGHPWSMQHDSSHSARWTSCFDLSTTLSIRVDSLDTLEAQKTRPRAPGPGYGLARNFHFPECDSPSRRDMNANRRNPHRDSEQMVSSLRRTRNHIEWRLLHVFRAAASVGTAALGRGSSRHRDRATIEIHRPWSSATHRDGPTIEIHRPRSSATHRDGPTIEIHRPRAVIET